jgi:hypothetical protein
LATVPFPFPLVPSEGLVCMDAGFDRNKGGLSFSVNSPAVAFDDDATACQCNGDPVMSPFGWMSMQLSPKTQVDKYTKFLPVITDVDGVVRDTYSRSCEFMRRAVVPTVGLLYTAELANRWKSQLLYRGRDRSGASTCALNDSEFLLGDDEEHHIEWVSSLKNVAIYRTFHGNGAVAGLSPKLRTVLLSHRLNNTDVKKNCDVGCDSYKASLDVGAYYPSAYYPSAQFLPRGFLNELCAYCQVHPGSILLSEACRALATELVLEWKDDWIDWPVGEGVTPPFSCRSLCERIASAGGSGNKIDGLKYWALKKPKLLLIQ